MNTLAIQERQQKLTEQLKNKFTAGCKILQDKLGESFLVLDSASSLVDVLQVLKNEPELFFDYLSDVSAYDNVDHKDGPQRFVVFYQLFSTKFHTRVRIKILCDEEQEVASITKLWPSANWFEREVFDMYGIKFSGHPNLMRILMDERFSGHPLRKEYPIKQREPFSDNVRISLPEKKLELEK